MFDNHPSPHGVVNSLDPDHPRSGPPFQSSAPTLVELASGVDALYLSGRALLPGELLARLDDVRATAVEIDASVPFDFGGIAFALAPHAFGKHRFCLEHPYGRVGLTSSSKLPALRIQPRAEFLHGVGPRAAVEAFREVLEMECGPVLLLVSRLDLFADFQGWDLHGDQRREFVCRAVDLTTLEAAEEFNGLQFGKRGSGTISARLYDKTIESEKTGSGYWKTVWGETRDLEHPVLRVEFEISRGALREFNANTPEEVLNATGSLWSYLTSRWLSHRVPTSDETKSRWPVSREWECVQRAGIGEDDWGITRMYGGKRMGLFFNLLPGLVGYLASFGALTNSVSFADMIPHLSTFLTQYAGDTGQTLNERITDKRRKNLLL
jgi:hypothetical protein